MKAKKVKCSCNQYIDLLLWNSHSSSCPYFLGQLNNQIKSTVVKEAKQSVNRSTFTCSICKVANLDREGLIKHVKTSHKNDTAVCPICICQPWGDPNYVTHLYGHLIKRHNFDYDTTVDYNESEDDVLQRVLQESMLTK
jgi:hypothetical protein